MTNLIQESASRELNTKARHLNKDFILNNHGCVWRSFKNENLEDLEHIYIDYFDILCIYGRQFSSEDPSLVQDCIHDLFIHLYIKQNNLSDTTSIKFYLMKSLRRLILYKKTIKKHKDLSLDTNSSPVLIEQYNIENKIFTDEKNETQKVFMQKYILQLPKRQREAIYLRFYSALKFDEIAEKMNLNTKSVYKIIYKGLKSLRMLYEKRNLELFMIEILLCLSYSYFYVS